jgi:hypothetical protein
MPVDLTTFFALVRPDPASPLQERVLHEGHLNGIPSALGNQTCPQTWHWLEDVGLFQQWEPQEGHLTGDSTLLNHVY